VDVDDVRTLSGRGLILPCRLVSQSEDLEVQPGLRSDRRAQG
jgi:hypothetical protein